MYHKRKLNLWKKILLSMLLLLTFFLTVSNVVLCPIQAYSVVWLKHCGFCALHPPTDSDWSSIYEHTFIESSLTSYVNHGRENSAQRWSDINEYPIHCTLLYNASKNMENGKLWEVWWSTMHSYSYAPFYYTFACGCRSFNWISIWYILRW